MLLIFLLHLYNNNVNDLCKRAGARHPGPPFSDFRETIHRVAHAGDHHVTSLLLLSCHTGVLLSKKLRKVTKVTDSVWRNLFPIFLSSWGDFKSKAKVKTKFPENFGAFYPSENGPLGERLLNVTIQYNEQVWWCSGNSYHYVHSFNSNFQETWIYCVWLPLSQWLG